MVTSVHEEGVRLPSVEPSTVGDGDESPSPATQALAVFGGGESTPFSAVRTAGVAVGAMACLAGKDICVPEG